MADRKRARGGATIDSAALAQVPALERVLEWACEHGGSFDGLHLALDAHGGVGLFAARDFAAGDTLAYVPRSCALTAATARESALGRRVLAAAAEWGALTECTDELLLCLFLTAGRLDASSERHHMIAAMPAESPEPCCWPEEIRAELAGTPVGLAVSHATARFALHAARLTRRLAAEGVVPERAASLESLLWARGMYHSRGYTGRLASPEAAAAPSGLPAPDGAADGVLLPIVDLMNHRHGQQITWQVEREGVRFVAGAAVRAGGEVCTNYGARPNEELLFSYGFALREPAADAVSLVLAEQRGAEASGRAPAGGGGGGAAGAGVVRHTHYVRRMAHGGIPASLLRALGEASAACGGADAAEGARVDGQPAGASGASAGAVGVDGRAAARGEGEGPAEVVEDKEEAVVMSGEALEMLLDVLRQKRDALRPSAAADSRALKRLDRNGRAAGARDVHLRGAVAVYRSGQRQVLKEAIGAVRELLEAAEEDGGEEGEADAAEQ